MHVINDQLAINFVYSQVTAAHSEHNHEQLSTLYNVEITAKAEDENLKGNINIKDQLNMCNLEISKINRLHLCTHLNLYPI